MEVDLSMSDLNEVPMRDILKFKRVNSLDLSNNNLRILPNKFSNLVHLTVLDLSRNKLKELPEDFGNLVKLRHLDLYRNQLQNLPLSFSKLKNLSWLDLKDNPLAPPIAKAAGLCLDTKACQTCAKNIVEFFTRLESEVAVQLEMRTRDRQRSLEYNQKKKQEEKKIKKKEKQKGKKVASIGAEEPLTIEKAHLNHKVKLNEDTKKQKSSSFLGTIFKMIFLILSIYLAFILFKVYDSKDPLNSARNLIIHDYNRILKVLQIWGPWIKQYMQNTYKQFVNKYL